MPAHHTLGSGTIGRRQVLSDLLSRRPGCAGGGSGSARYSRGVRIGNWVEDEFPAGKAETPCFLASMSSLHYTDPNTRECALPSACPFEAVRSPLVLTKSSLTDSRSHRAQPRS